MGKDRIIVFGTGSVSEYIFHKLNLQKVSIIAFVNSDTTATSFHSYGIIKPEKIKDYDYDYILIASGYVEKITQLLISVGVPSNKIVSYIFDDDSFYHNMCSFMNEYLSINYNRDKVFSWINKGERIPLMYPAVFWDGDNEVESIEKDFVREQTVNLISKQIYLNNVQGNVAELGVFKGDFTVVLNRIFPDKTLYLYDTFEGFSLRDISNDQSIENKTGESQKFKDTSVQYVLSRLSKNSQVVVNKGIFPDTFDESVGEFCFVSIDLNLYAPVKAALDLMYPHLSSGGYILVSDYYAPFYSGSRVAVDEFCKETNKYIIPVADFYGSALIIKD